MQCRGCGGDRFRTKSKKLKMFRCRQCGADYQDGVYLGKPVVEPVAVVEVVPEVEVVHPEVVPAADVQPTGFIGRLVNAVKAICA